MPKITVGIPAYNAEKYIGWAIKSVLSQTFGDFELIITDDGSTDRTVEIARSFDDPRITVVADGENHGISYRLNQQIDLAKGEYFARMDADDIMMPNRLDKQFNYMTNHPDVDVIGGGSIIINENNEIYGKRKKLKDQRISTEMWAAGISFNHPTVFGKINYFRDFKYDSSFNGVEDRHLWLRSHKSHKLVIVSDIFMFYRDPQRFNLNTYLFRRKRNRQLWRSQDVKNFYGTNKRLRTIGESYIKSAIAFIVSKLGLSSIILNKRNQPCGEDLIQYKNILKEIIEDEKNCNS